MSPVFSALMIPFLGTALMMVLDVVLG